MPSPDWLVPGICTSGKFALYVQLAGPSRDFAGIDAMAWQAFGIERPIELAEGCDAVAHGLPGVQRAFHRRKKAHSFQLRMQGVDVPELGFLFAGRDQLM